MLNHLCNIEQKTVTQNTTTGAISESWSVYLAGVPCKIDAVSVKDFIQSGQLQAEVVARITVPYFDGFEPSMRIVATCGCHSGRIYNPVAKLEDNITGNLYFTLPCSENVNNG